MPRLLQASVALLCWSAATALAAPDAGAVRQLAAEDTEGKLAGIRALAAEADPGAARVLQALSDGALLVAGERVVLVDDGHTVDAATGERLEPAPASPEPITINNRVRRALGPAIAALELQDPRREVRLAAARQLAGGADAALAAPLSRALLAERDGAVKDFLALAYAQATLGSGDASARLAAATALGESGDPGARNLLERLLDARAEPDAQVRAAAAVSLHTVEWRLARGELIGRIFSGLSLGSILLLASLGLAISYGVMGVINMAHGELLMVGAYAAFGVQALFRRYLPFAADLYVVAALPAAFAAAFLVGVAMERTVIRFLYHRPLESLLATWGVSLLLTQSARVLFGAQNVEVANPSWMSGGASFLGIAVLPWNRIAIVGFALAVLTVVWLLLNRTRLGLYVRAVTQNRTMAGCVGVPTSRVDTLAFGLGAGVAGLGGVALSQIANVGPDMGQGYIVDAFMVVVLGGVGQLAGAAWAALGLGVASKFLEGWTGAVVAKIAILVFVIVFIQRRPQGLFAPKGRLVEG
jgi:urea transport system permease protein